VIANLRGTHGSGKSHIVRQLLDRYSAVPAEVDSKGRPTDYKMNLANGSQLYVVGPYYNACGGCDAIQPYSLIWPRVVRFAELGHVLFEGALVSSSYGNIGRDSEVYGDQFVFAFLDTPLSVCLERITARRVAKGNMKPLDPKNTQSKYDGIKTWIPRMRDELHRRVVILDYRNPIPPLLKLFYGG